jgi:hypothetical protein
MTIKVACKGKNGIKRRPVYRRVKGTPTRSKYFVVTPAVGFDGKRFFELRNVFTLTHIPSGFSLISNLTSVRQGELVAIVADNIPVEWKSLTPFNAKRRFKKLDPFWLNWAAAFNSPGVERLKA